MPDFFNTLDTSDARRLVSGQWRVALGGVSTTSTHAIGVERANLIQLPAGTVLQNIAINVATLGAGSVVRLGVRADSAGMPAALLSDLGTVDTSTTGVKTLAIAFTVPPTSRLWLTATAQVGSAPVLTARQTAGSDLDWTDSTIITTVPAAIFQTGVTGALPAAFATSLGLIAAATAIGVQAA